MRWSLARGGAATVGVLILAAVLVRQENRELRYLLPPLLALAALPALFTAGMLARIPVARRDLRWVLGVGLLARLPFLAADPYLSDDVYRYIWDGRVQVAAEHPYGLAPEAPALDGVERNEPEARRVRQRINHPEIPTVYPPLLELVFFANAKVDRWLGSPDCGGWGVLLTWRAILLLADLGIAWLLARRLAATGRDARLALLYLWHPLSVVEGMWSAHAEALAVVAVLAMLALLMDRRCTAAGVACACAGWVKLLPFALLPLVARHAGWRGLGAALVAALVCIVPYAAVDPGAALAGLEVFADRWYYNDATFHWLGWIFEVDIENRLLPETQTLRRALAGAFALVALAAPWLGRDPERAVLLVLGAFVILTPVLHPWYLLGVLPFAILCRSRGWLVLSITVLFSYFVPIHERESGVWVELPFLKALELAPPFALLAYDAARRLWGGGPATGA